MLNANMQAAARRQLHSAIIRDEPGGFEARAAPVRRYFRARRPDQSTAAGHAKERDGTLRASTRELGRCDENTSIRLLEGYL